MSCVWDDPVAVRRELALEDIHIVRDKPPILADDGVNHEYNYLFGYSEEGDSSHNNVDPAVFHEISSMLSMVRQVNEPEANTNKNKSKNASTKTSNVVILSKLNPEVNEFRPNTVKVDSEKIDELTEAEKEIEELKKLIDEPKVCSIKKKKMRNAAIANIMRLKSLSVDETPLKLMTPKDFIEASTSEKNESTIATTSSNFEKGAIQTVKTTPELGGTDKLVITEEKNVIQTAKVTPELGIEDELVLDEVKESIKKVEKWLGREMAETSGNSTARVKEEKLLCEETSERKTLETISDKGLTYTVVRSSSTATSSPMPEVPAPTVKKFVPTGNTTLYNKYVQNAKVISERKEDMWSKLERELKEIDEKKQLVNS